MQKLFSFRFATIPRGAPVIVMALLAILLRIPAAQAFPPAPDGLIYGLVKDQYGAPLMNTQAKVVLITSDGKQIVNTVVPGLAIGVNYMLSVPMDAAVTSDLYTANALMVGTPFKLYVVSGSTTNLPIQMTGASVLLGKSAKQTRLDLTLGVDSNGNGIPDAWEKLFLADINTNLALTNLNAGVDYAHSGRTLMQEFLLGNHPFNPQGIFDVRLVTSNDGATLLEFTTMFGRSYTALGSSDLKTWTQLSFTIPSEGSTPAVRAFYYASDIRTLQIQIIQPVGGSQMRFFKLLLQ